MPRAVLEEGRRVLRKGRKGSVGLWLGGNKTDRAPNDSRGIWYVSELGRGGGRADDKVVMCTR